MGNWSELLGKFLIFHQVFLRIAQDLSLHLVIYLPSAQLTDISNNIVFIIKLCSFDTKMESYFLFVPFVIWMRNKITANDASFIILDGDLPVTPVLPLCLFWRGILKWRNNIFKAERIVNIGGNDHKAAPVMVLWLKNKYLVPLKPQTLLDFPVTNLCQISANIYCLAEIYFFVDTEVDFDLRKQRIHWPLS